MSPTGARQGIRVSRYKETQQQQTRPTAMKEYFVSNFPVNRPLNVRALIMSFKVREGGILVSDSCGALYDEGHKLTRCVEYDDGWAIVQSSNFSTLFILSREQNPSTSDIDVCNTRSKSSQRVFMLIII